MARALLLALSSLALGALAPASASARPAISHMRATHTSLPSTGGTINVTARTRNGRHCTLQASPRIAGLPHTIRCRRSISFRVRVPSNSRESRVRYVLTLHTSGRKRATAHVTITVAAHVAEHTPPPPPPEEHVVQVAAGTYGACAVISNGHVYCWGENFYGEVGNGTSGSTPVATPAEVSGISEAKQVAVGEYDACALLVDGHVDCWGDNEFGQTGNGETSEKVTTPVQVGGVEGASQIAVGWEFACALLSGGHVTCWGTNDDGTIGDGTEPKTKNTFLTPTEADVEHVVTLRAHDQRACVVVESGSVECWGNDFLDQLGNGKEKTFSDTPVVSEYVAGASGVAIGGGHTCVLESGAVACWGENHKGQLGDGEINEYLDVIYKPAAAVGVSTAAEIDAGEEFSCARLTDGHEDCWGENIYYELGNGKSSPGAEPVDTPTEVVGLSGVAQIATGGSFNCALLSSGHVDCWGFDQNGQAGTGESEPALEVKAPTPVVGLP